MSAMDAAAVTLDVDWAPDFMIDYAASLLAGAGVRATWFVTHDSPAVRRLREHGDRFELGIHPNFLPGSTHGASAAEVLRHCMALVPDATTMRTHALVQSSPLLAEVLRSTPITTDSSLLLPRHPHLAPVEFVTGGRALLRVPFYWEDDDEMEMEHPRWHLGDECDGPGLRVFDFHPVHLWLNSGRPGHYAALRAAGPLGALTPEAAAAYVNPREGARTFFVELLARLGAAGGGVLLRDVERAYRADWAPAEAAA